MRHANNLTWKRKYGATLDARTRECLRAGLCAPRDDMIEFLKDLVAIPTENPPGRAYPECVERITGKLRELGLPHQLIDLPAPADAAGGNQAAPAQASPRRCIQSFVGRGARTIYFHGHYDVVPAATPAQFVPRIEGKNLFGRGASDMKSGLVAMIYAARAIHDCGIEIDGRIGLTLVPDEETGGACGSASLARMGLLGDRGIGMLTAEPTGGAIWNANRGAISLRVTVKGKPAHVGLHYRGVNAFEQMLAVAGALAKLKKTVGSRKTRFRIEPRQARSSILMMGGECAGGTNFNLVPERCSFTVDRRINPEEDLAAEKARLFRVLGRMKQKGIELDAEILQEGSAAATPKDHPLALALADSVAEVTGKAPEFAMCPGLLENRFYADRGIPALAYGPGLLSVSHGPNEFLPLENICDCAEIYALAAVRMLAVDGHGPSEPSA